MNKIVILSLVALLSYGANAFAAGSALGSKSVSTAGAAIFGGADATTAAAMNNRLVSLSKGVEAAVTFTASATNTSTGYVIVTKHTSGTKISGTSNDSTKLYWKQAATGDIVSGDVPSSDIGSTAFAVGTGWTEY
jgi:hypothetical protein